MMWNVKSFRGLRCDLGMSRCSLGNRSVLCSSQCLPEFHSVDNASPVSAHKVSGSVPGLADSLTPLPHPQPHPHPTTHLRLWPIALPTPPYPPPGAQERGRHALALPPPPFGGEEGARVGMCVCGLLCVLRSRVARGHMRDEPVLPVEVEGDEDVGWEEEEGGEQG